MNETKSDSSQEIGSAGFVDEQSDASSNSANPGTNPGPEANATGEIIARSRLLMSRGTAALLVIDVQEKLVPHIQNHSTIVWNIRRLIDGAAVLGVPALCTEQYPKGLGHTVPLLADRIEVNDEKSLFSCRDCVNVVSRLKQQQRHQILICGIETHVCVQQTALDLIAMGFDVWVAIDAVGSRYDLDHSISLRRMESAGVSLTTTESAMFEWCEVSGTHEFKRISTLVREKAPDHIDIPDARFFPRSAARYVVQTSHLELSRDNDQVTNQLRFIVRSTANGSVMGEYEGQVTCKAEHPAEVVSRQGSQAVEVSPDGTAVSVQDSNGTIQMIYLPIGDPRTNHPRWKVRRSERHIGSEEYKHDYEITYNVVEHKTDSTFRAFTGYEHRDPDTGELTHVSGVRQIEISSDGRWMVVTEISRPPELIELPAES